MKSYRIEGLEVARPRGAGGRAFVADTWTPMQPFRECGCREGYCMPVATVVTVQNILKLFKIAETGAHTQGALARRHAEAPGESGVGRTVSRQHSSTRAPAR